MGVYRDPAIQFSNSVRMKEQRRALHAALNLDLAGLVSKWPLYVALIPTFVKVDYFLLDFSNAKARADDLDMYLLTSAANISEIYADMVAISARQVIGSTELTVSMGADNQWNMSDIMMFMKDVGRSRWEPIILSSKPFSWALQKHQPCGSHLRVFSFLPVFERNLCWVSITSPNGVYGFSTQFSTRRVNRSWCASS